MTPKIVILDAELANSGDLSWADFDDLGDLHTYDKTSPDQIIERAADADILITNKFKLGEEHFKACPNLKLICMLATGYDNVDVKSARAHGITVCNAQAYSIDSVAQHVFSLLLAAANHVAEHNASVQEGEWYRRQWSYTLLPFTGLKGKTIGICGYGQIGKKVGDIAQAFGMNVLAFTRSPDPSCDVTYVNIDQLCKEADVISVHLPHSEHTHEMFDRELFGQMKEDAIFINTGRGALIKEDDLRDHLRSHSNFTAAVDVLSQEPPQEGHPLIGLDNCIITPHHAWANPEARANLLRIVADNVRGYLAGAPQNVVN